MYLNDLFGWKGKWIAKQQRMSKKKNCASYLIGNDGIIVICRLLN